MPNVLFVSIAFPPKSDAECLQTAKYFHYLQQDESLKIEVVTSAIPTLYMKYDEKLEGYAQGSTTDMLMKDLKGDVLEHKNVTEIKEVIAKQFANFVKRMIIIF